MYFREYDGIAPAKTIFASNTSSLPISEMASATTRLDRNIFVVSIYARIYGKTHD